MTQQGRLVAVGVGPGDPELLTLKAARLLRSADVVVTPVGDRSAASIAHGIIESHLDCTRQELLTWVFPMKKDPAQMQAHWEEAAEGVARLVAAGKTVVFATLGDPFLYSTFLYVHAILAERHPAIPVEVVPGISSIHAAASLVGRPLGLAADRIAILPATFEAQKLRQALRDFDSIVLMKVHRVFAEIRDLLRETGRLGGAVYVKRVGLPGETVIRDLDRVQPEDLDYLSLVLVGK